VNTPRLLVIRGGAIGDFILTLPALDALRERWPRAHIEILGYPRIIELARQRRYADAVRSIEAGPLARFFAPDAELDPALVEYFRGFNLVISYIFDPDKIFADNIRRCGVRHVVEAAPRPTDLHAAEHYCKPLESLAIYTGKFQPRLHLNPTDRAAAKKFLPSHNINTDAALVAIHPGSGGDRKNWPPEKFGALARWLADELDAQLLVVHGEADDIAVAKFLEQISPRPFHRARGLGLVELAAVLEHCAAFVGNDSGVTHLAAAVGTPTIAMFGPASTPLWHPRGENVFVIPFGPRDTALARDTIVGLLPETIQRR
jgi:heptosyltransferase-2